MLTSLARLLRALDGIVRHVRAGLKRRRREPLGFRASEPRAFVVRVVPLCFVPSCTEPAAIEYVDCHAPGGKLQLCEECNRSLILAIHGASPSWKLGRPPVGWQ